MFRYGVRTKSGQIVNFLSEIELDLEGLRHYLTAHNPRYEIRCWWNRNEANPFVNWV